MIATDVHSIQADVSLQALALEAVRNLSSTIEQSVSEIETSTTTIANDVHSIQSEASLQTVALQTVRDDLPVLISASQVAVEAKLEVNRELSEIVLSEVRIGSEQLSLLRQQQEATAAVQASILTALTSLMRDCGLDEPPTNETEAAMVRP